MAGQILFCGDPHGRFGHLIEAVHAHRPAAVILLGDVQPQKPLDIALAEILNSTEVHFIHGNHDTDSDADVDNLFGSTLAARNLHGRVVEIAGLRIAGLGGIFRQKIWAPPEPWHFESPAVYAAQCGKGNLWRGGIPRKHRSSIFPIDYFALMHQRADILVTHEAPSAHPNGWAAIDDLARSLQVRKAFHGHHHDNLDYSEFNRQRDFQVTGVGLRGITDETGAVIVEEETEEMDEVPYIMSRSTQRPS